MDYSSSVEKIDWYLSPKFRGNVVGPTKGQKEGLFVSFGLKTSKVPGHRSFEHFRLGRLERVFFPESVGKKPFRLIRFINELKMFAEMTENDWWCPSHFIFTLYSFIYCLFLLFPFLNVSDQSEKLWSSQSFRSTQMTGK